MPRRFYAFMQYAEGRPSKGDKGIPLYDYLLSQHDARIAAGIACSARSCLPDEKDAKSRPALPIS